MKPNRKRKAVRESANAQDAKRTLQHTPATRSAFSAKAQPVQKISYVQPIEASPAPQEVTVKRKKGLHQPAIAKIHAPESFGQEAASQSSSGDSASEFDRDDINIFDRYNTSLDSSNPSRGLNDLLRFIPENDYPRGWKRARELIAEDIIKEAQKQYIIQIIGATSAGKCTFAKYLLKSVLFPPEHLSYEHDGWSRVLILDLDPTKSEFSLPGHISLVAANDCIPQANFCSGAAGLNHNQKLLRSHAVGLSGHQDDPEHYLAAVRDLMEKCRKDAGRTPVFVCCPSFEREAARGMNGRTTAELTRLIRANHICCLAQTVSHTTESIQEVRSAIDPSARLWELESIKAVLTYCPNASSLRDATLSAYFHAADLQDGAASAVSLSAIKPYAISYAASGDVAAVFIFGDIPPNHPRMLTRILNGSVVGIANTTLDPDVHEIVLGEEDQIPYLTSRNGSNPIPLDPAITNIVGLGLVRSIDHEKRLLYIITPHHVAKQLEGTSRDILLIHGITDSPGWAFEEDHSVQHKESGRTTDKSYHSETKPLYIGTAKKGMQVVKSRKFKKRA